MLPTIEETLDAIDRGRLWTDIAPRLPGARRATVQASREELRPVVRDGLTALAHLALAHAGEARWELSWTGAPVRLSLPSGVDEDLAGAVDAAVADAPDTADLRRLLARSAPQAQALSASAPQTPAPQTAAPAEVPAPPAAAATPEAPAPSASTSA